MNLLHVSKSRMLFAAAAVLLSLPYSARADSITISTSETPTMVLNPSSDSISLNSTSGTYSTSSGAFVFQSGNWIIGNSSIADQVIPFSLTDSITLNGITENVTISGQDSVTTSVDQLTIFAGTPVLFGNELFALQPFDISGYNIGDDLALQLEATVTPTPEPGSFILLATGLVGGAVLLLRKRSLGGA